MRKVKVLIYLMSFITILSCSNNDGNNVNMKKVYIDSPFIQEMHIGYAVGTDSQSNDVRSIAIDSSQNVWIATRGGIFVKGNNDDKWQAVQDKENSGPSFTVAVDSDNSVWFGTWNGLYKYTKGEVQKIESVIPPISTITATPKGVYAFGHYETWMIKEPKLKSWV